ncbi:retrovirus-related pol polyprotein from transposon TNT 1-94 [Tanacetum coccineum]
MIDIDEYSEMACKYLEKVKECKCHEIELSKQKDTVSKEDYHKLYFKIQDLKAQLHDRDIAISELKKLIEKSKGKSMETKFDKPLVVRQTNVIKVPKPSVLGLIHNTSVSMPQLRSNQMKDKVVQNNSQVKIKQKEVEDHHRISSRAKRSSFESLTVTRSRKRLDLLHMDLCGPIRIETINGKKHILVIVDDYSRYTWTLFLRSKDETPEAEAIATACYTQNRSLIIPRHEKTPYHIINERKPSLKHLHIFGCTCYLVKDGENLDKMKEKGDPCIFVGYSTTSKRYRVYNKRIRLIVESIHINFDEIKEMTSDHNSSGLAPQRQKASDYDNYGPAPQLQNPSSERYNMTIRIHDNSNEPSSSKVVPNVFPSADKADLS